jgi:hypothetical protein
VEASAVRPQRRRLILEEIDDDLLEQCGVDARCAGDVPGPDLSLPRHRLGNNFTTAGGSTCSRKS